MTDQTATIPAGQPPTEDTIGLCGYCGVPRESHPHGYVSTADTIAAAPHRVTAAGQAAARTLTVAEHDRAWHAIEGTVGQPDADPGTVLAAVLRALRIEAPTAEDEQAPILAKRATR